MAEQKLTMKKRKRVSSTSTHHRSMGIFTRSKSQIYIHRSRSGQTRSDSNRPENKLYFKKPKRSSNRHDLFALMTKDLRTHRVFSHPLDHEEYENGGSKLAENGFQGDPERRLEIESPDGCLEKENGIVKGSFDAAMPDGVKEILTTESVQMTPPDAEIFAGDLQLNSNNNEAIKMALALEQQLNGSVHKNQIIHANNDNTIDRSNSKVLNHSFRAKLFKTPNSFSYRRLLPYLEEIARDNSCDPNIGDFQNTEKGMKKKPLQSFSASECKEMMIDKSKTDSGSREHTNISYNDSNLSSMRHTPETSVPDDSNEVFIMTTPSHAPVFLGCSSKSAADEGIGKFEVQNPSKDHDMEKLDSCLSSLMEDSQFNKSNSSYELYGSTKLKNGGSERTDEDLSENSENVNGFDCSMFTVINKGHSGEDDRGDQCSDDTYQPETRQENMFNAEGPHKSQNQSCADSSLSDCERHELCGNAPCGENYHGEVLNRTDDSKENETRGENIFNAEGPHKSQNHSCADASLSVRERHELCGNAPRSGNSHCEVLNRTDDSNEKCVLRTPPDADICRKPEGDGIGGVNVEPLLQSPYHALEKTLSESIYGNKSGVDIKRSDSSPRSKPVLNRCSRLKLFKAPGSFGYRRLLPFLKDIVRDDYCASGNGFVSKLNSLEEKPPSPMLVSDCHETAVENFNGSRSHTEHHPGDFSALSVAMPATAQGSSELQVQQNTDAGGKSEIAPDVVDSVPGSQPSAVSLDFLVSPGPFPKEDASLALHQLPVNAQEDLTKSLMKCTNGVKPVDGDGLLQGPSQVEASVHLRITAPDCKKGILKKTPRGCRGACACLNCSSFRLHAERAFEFSRNQMQDAEEVAMDLIKRMSYLRNILEKSAFGTNDCAPICMNQVKDACRKASEAEEIAKNRLHQMNYDLDIHCRIPCEQRPTVRFADYVQEKVIPGVDLLSK